MFVAVLGYMVIAKVGKWKILFFCGVGFAVSFFGLWLYDLVWHPAAMNAVVNPVEHLWLMVVYQLKLNGVVRAASSYAWYPPVAWVSPFGVNAFNPLRWIWLSVGGRLVYAWFSQPNAAVEYLMFPLLMALPVAYVVKKNAVALLSWLWIACSFLPWFVAGFFVRTEGNFYVVYSVPFLAIGCAYGYSLIGNRKLKYSLAMLLLKARLPKL
jgi:hypothetical protein